MPHIVVIGGGTGSFTVLSSLRDRDCRITALVSMADDGSSTGILRDELGVLPPGDVRQCLVALSDAPQELRQLFNYRFQEGGMAGHSFGNIFLSAVQKMTDNFADAVRVAGDVLRIKGEVVPITLDDVRLKISWDDGTAVHGEGKIDTMHFAPGAGRPTLDLEPRARINPVAIKALQAADSIIFAPGDLYTSLGPLLAVDGVQNALAKSTAKKVYVCNLVSKPGQTTGFTVADYAAEIERFAGGQILDEVLYNTMHPPRDLFERYAKEGELLVEARTEEFEDKFYRAIGVPLVTGSPVSVSANDPHAAHRSYIRHDHTLLGDALFIEHSSDVS